MEVISLLLAATQVVVGLLLIIIFGAFAALLWQVFCFFAELSDAFNEARATDQDQGGNEPPRGY